MVTVVGWIFIGVVLLTCVVEGKNRNGGVIDFRETGNAITWAGMLIAGAIMVSN